MNSLGTRIKRKISEQDSSVHAIEKRAGLKPSAIQNIIYGRSKNPSISLIKAIAQALDCNIEDLVDSGELDHSRETRNTFSKLSKVDSSPQKDTKAWNQDLYLKCFNLVNSITSQHQINMGKNKILDIVDEIYNYSLGNNLAEPDVYFSNWLIERKTK